ncbi:hypothetical protein [Litchfieldella rifensis]|uniref:DUF4148 domain-containing protein n=1 Tax=Litchfieldella rifensis TaxID=762643 RepID=A0ABV7LTX9_9GAMM
MKIQTRVATLLFAALPIVAHAGIASERALQINQAAPTVSAANAGSATPDAVPDYRYDGASAAMVDARQQLIVEGEPRTRFPENRDEAQPSRQATGNS